MRARRLQLSLATGLCALAAALGATAAPAQGDFSDPLFLYVPVPHPPQAPPGAFQPPSGPPPTGFLNGPCGLTVDSLGRFYLSDYHHDAIDVFSTFKDEKTGIFRPAYNSQIVRKEPLDGPCGLALKGENLYVNYYHQYVARFWPAPSFGERSVIDSSDPTGVAVDPGSGDVYVNDRTYVAVYEPSGAPVLDEGEPLRIGLGSLGDGYGAAFSSYPGGSGHRLYVADAADNTVKIYDPAVDTTDPVATIDGHATPQAGFVSLRDAAVAVDDESGAIYVVDDLQPLYTEQPQAVVDVFSAGLSYEGHLKYQISDAKPAGLAVDNSGPLTGTQGRVYVTSGNTTEAGVYAYPPGATTTAFPLPGWPLGGCAGIVTCTETAGGDSLFGVVSQSVSAPTQVSTAADVSSAAGAPAAATATPPPRHHGHNRPHRPRRHRAKLKRGGR